ncbi:MAG: twin-arginine translocation signal domain-containing protein [Desulfosoma sp.]
METWKPSGISRRTFVQAVTVGAAVLAMPGSLKPILA